MFRQALINLILCAALLEAGELGFGAEYYNINDTQKKKEAFVNILLPKIDNAQRAIFSDRVFIIKFFRQYLFTNSFHSQSDILRLITLQKKYRIKQMYNEGEYLEKIDTIPVSLVLAQSAIESAWGESRFTREGNNIFGEWTWGKIGIIPDGRDEDAKHKLRIFESLDDSIAAYMLNLNRHYSYKEFRKLRADYRAQGKPFTGLAAAPTLTKYSQMREVYSRLITRVIKGNDFARYEKRRAEVLALK
ncbi:MAG: glucosaminidase domain-containing protein [Campylobacterales bacterium]|nr:glucosaminidase domain-containing protein [Campylobacterales bacterium]